MIFYLVSGNEITILRSLYEAVFLGFFPLIFSEGSQLTQQDKDAGQDRDERPAAQAGRKTVGLRVARHDVALLVAAAHTDGQRAGAGLDRLLSVGDEEGQVEHGLVLLRPASATRQDPRCVVCREINRPGKDEPGAIAT